MIRGDLCIHIKINNRKIMSYHYKNSRTSTSNDEPVYLTRFVCTFVLPEVLRPIYGTQALVEQIKRVGGLETDKLPETVEQAYRFHKRRFLGSVVETNVDLEMEFDVNVNDSNVMYPFDVLRAWQKLGYDPNTGAMTIKRDYVGQLLLELHDKLGNVLRRWFFRTIFPIVPTSGKELNYLEEAIYVPTMTFAVENYDDITN